MQCPRWPACPSGIVGPSLRDTPSAWPCIASFRIPRETSGMVPNAPCAVSPAPVPNASFLGGSSTREAALKGDVGSARVRAGSGRLVRYSRPSVASGHVRRSHQKAGGGGGTASLSAQRILLRHRLGPLCRKPSPGSTSGSVHRGKTIRKWSRLQNKVGLALGRPARRGLSGAPALGARPACACHREP